MKGDAKPDKYDTETHQKSCLAAFDYFFPHSFRSEQKQEWMDQEFRVDKQITEQDGSRRKDPAVEANHQHGRHVQPGDGGVSGDVCVSLLKL